MKLSNKFKFILFTAIILFGGFNISSIQAASPIGHLDEIRDGVAYGWTLDPDAPDKNLTVHFYLDGPAGSGVIIGNAKANLPRPDVNQVTGYPGDHGFAFYIPFEYRDGKTHWLYAYGIDITQNPNSHLADSPKSFNIPPPSVFYPNKGKLWIGTNFLYSLDTKKLFTEPNQWQKARSYVSIVKMASWQLYKMLYEPSSLLKDPFNLTPEQIFSESELKDALIKLNAWGIDFGLEIASISSNSCEPRDFSLYVNFLKKIESLGNKVKYIAWDEPFYQGKWLCHWEIENIVDENIKFINTVKSYDPSIIIGDIEPWPTNREDMNKEVLKEWIKKFREKAGYELPFLHLDIDYAHVKNRNINMNELKEIAEFCKARGIKFGIIIWHSDYNYPEPLDSDKTFYDKSMAFASIIHSIVDVDEIVVQSWDKYPKYNLPDYANYSFTQLVRDYANKYPPAIRPVNPPPAAPIRLRVL